MRFKALSFVAAFAVAALAAGAGNAVAQDKVFSIATNAEPEVFDPAHFGSPQSFTTLWNVYEGFTWQNLKGDQIPALAESWDINRRRQDSSSFTSAPA